MLEACFLVELGPDLTDPAKHQEIMEAQREICEESEDIILASELPPSLRGDDMKDEGGIHFTQKALNLIGEDAGRTQGLMWRHFLTARRKKKSKTGTGRRQRKGNGHERKHILNRIGELAFPILLYLLYR